MSPATYFLFFSSSIASWPVLSNCKQKALTQVISSATTFSLPLRYCTSKSYSDITNLHRHNLLFLVEDRGKIQTRTSLFRGLSVW